MGSWQGLRKAIKERLHPTVQKRLDVNYTVYKRSASAAADNWRFWVTIDGTEVYSVDLYHPDPLLRGLAATDVAGESLPEAALLLGGIKEWLNMSIEDALASPNPIIRGFALVDSRMGNRRLKEYKLREGEHPLVATLHALRTE